MRRVSELSGWSRAWLVLVVMVLTPWADSVPAWAGMAMAFNFTLARPFAPRPPAPSPPNMCSRLIDPQSCPLSGSDEGRCTSSEGWSPPCSSSAMASRYRVVILAARRRGSPLCVPISARLQGDTPACTSVSAPLCNPSVTGGPTQKDCIEAVGTDFPVSPWRITSGTGTDGTAQRVTPGPGPILGFGHYPASVWESLVFTYKAVWLPRCGMNLYNRLSPTGPDDGHNAARLARYSAVWDAGTYPYMYIAEAVGAEVYANLLYATTPETTPGNRMSDLRMTGYLDAFQTFLNGKTCAQAESAVLDYGHSTLGLW